MALNQSFLVTFGAEREFLDRLQLCIKVKDH
jgi:hypothetical protein